MLLDLTQCRWLASNAEMQVNGVFALPTIAPSSAVIDPGSARRFERAIK
jgi:hypothetical protein